MSDVKSGKKKNRCETRRASRRVFGEMRWLTRAVASSSVHTGVIPVFIIFFETNCCVYFGRKKVCVALQNDFCTDFPVTPGRNAGLLPLFARRERL